MPRQLVRDAVQLPCFSVDAAQGRVHFGDRHAAAAELYFELRAGTTKAPEEDFRLELVVEKRLAAIFDVVAQGDPCDLCDLLRRRMCDPIGGDRLLHPGQIDRIVDVIELVDRIRACLLYTSPSPRDLSASRMPSSA